jgi:hypothetical protein
MASFFTNLLKLNSSTGATNRRQDCSNCLAVRKACTKAKLAFLMVPLPYLTQHLQLKLWV